MREILSVDEVQVDANSTIVDVSMYDHEAQKAFTFRVFSDRASGFNFTLMSPELDALELSRAWAWLAGQEELRREVKEAVNYRRDELKELN